MMSGTTVLPATVPIPEVHLTAAGAAIMTLSILVVLGLMTFCMARILGEERPDEHHHAPLDIDTKDLDP